MDHRDVVGERLDIDAIIRSWRAAGSRLDEVSRRAVVAAVAHELARREGPRPGWTASLYEFDPELSIEIEDAALLRTVLHGSLAADRPPAAVISIHHRVGVIADELIAAAASRRAAALEQTALLDPLTGLRNRRAASLVFEAALAHARRYERPVSVAVIDLDGLKRINDTLGHAAGDDALRRFAAAVSENLRAGDAAFRYGGDEFIVLSPDTTASELRHLFDRLVSVAPPFTVGIAEAPADGEEAATLLAAADARLYAERRGRPSDRGPMLGRAQVGILSVALAAVAAGVAEAIRALANLNMRGFSTHAWRGTLIAAPLLAGGGAALAGPARLRDAWLRSSVMACIVLLALVAMLTPLLSSASGQLLVRDPAPTTVAREVTTVPATPVTPRAPATTDPVTTDPARAPDAAEDDLAPTATQRPLGPGLSTPATAAGSRVHGAVVRRVAAPEPPIPPVPPAPPVSAAPTASPPAAPPRSTPPAVEPNAPADTPVAGAPAPPPAPDDVGAFDARPRGGSHPEGCDHGRSSRGIGHGHGGRFDQGDRGGEGRGSVDGADRGRGGGRDRSDHGGGST